MKNFFSIILAICICLSTLGASVYGGEIGAYINNFTNLGGMTVELDVKIFDIIGGKKVVLTATASGSNPNIYPVLYYSLDGAEPLKGFQISSKSYKVKKEIELTESKTIYLRAIAKAVSGEYYSDEYSKTITIAQVSKPSISSNNNTVEIQSSTSGADIYYTTDGSTPTTDSDLYESSITIDKTSTVQAIAVKEGYANSSVDSLDVLYTNYEIYHCHICDNEMASDDKLYDENGNLICQDCYNELMARDETDKIYCYYCEDEIRTMDEMFYDEDDNVICEVCYNEIQNEVVEPTYWECPHCSKFFEDGEDIYDGDGYVICPYCNECIDDIDDIEDVEENPEQTEIEFLTSDWASDEVYEAYQNNLIPDEMIEAPLYKTISREEFAAVAVKLYENIIGEVPCITIDDTPFTDCNYASEYNDYIAAAYELGITNGTKDTTFSPYESITREQLATMLYRVIKLADVDEIYDFDINNMRKFYDDTEIFDYAKESVYFMTKYGIVRGVDDVHFNPLDTATKEQSLLISVRCINNLLVYLNGGYNVI